MYRIVKYRSTAGGARARGEQRRREKEKRKRKREEPNLPFLT
jgi:hypothetical protein